MSLQISCPKCNSSLAVESSLLGKKIRCSSCQTVIAVAGTPLAKPVRPIASPPEQDFSSLPAVPPASIHPYRSGTRKRPPSNKAIVWTAVAGISALAVFVGGVVLFRIIQGPSSTVASSDVDTVHEGLFAPVLHTDTAIDQPSDNSQTDASPQTPNALQIGDTPNFDQGTTPQSSKLNPLVSEPAKPKRTPKPPTELPPPDESDLQRVHIPEGYSIAVPPGFSAVNRAINKSSAIYGLLWQDGMRMTFIVTSDRSISANSPIPSVHASKSPDGKRTIKPIATTSGVGHNETYHLDGMNVSFVEIEQDVSHEDMTEQLQFMFSGAMTPEMKRQYAHLMQEKVAFQTTLVMKAMDDQSSLEVLIAEERPAAFSAPDQWLRVLKTLRHQSPTESSLIPRPFLHKYKKR